MRGSTTPASSFLYLYGYPLLFSPPFSYSEVLSLLFKVNIEYPWLFLITRITLFCTEPLSSSICCCAYHNSFVVCQTVILYMDTMRMFQCFSVYSYLCCFQHDRIYWNALNTYAWLIFIHNLSFYSSYLFYWIEILFKQYILITVPPPCSLPDSLLPFLPPGFWVFFQFLVVMSRADINMAKQYLCIGI